MNIENTSPAQSFTIVITGPTAAAAAAGTATAPTLPATVAAAKRFLEIPQPKPKPIEVSVSASAAGSAGVSAATKRVVLGLINRPLPQPQFQNRGYPQPVASSANGAASAAAAAGINTQAPDYLIMPTPHSHFSLLKQLPAKAALAYTYRGVNSENLNSPEMVRLCTQISLTNSIRLKVPAAKVLKELQEYLVGLGNNIKDKDYVLKGEILLQLKQFNDAFDALKQAAILNPKNVEALINCYKKMPKSPEKDLIIANFVVLLQNQQQDDKFNG